MNAYDLHRHIHMVADHAAGGEARRGRAEARPALPYHTHDTTLLTRQSKMSDELLKYVTTRLTLPRKAGSRTLSPMIRRVPYRFAVASHRLATARASPIQNYLFNLSKTARRRGVRGLCARDSF